MQTPEQVSFTIDFRGSILRVSEHQVGKNQVFRILFPDQRKPLVINLAKGYEGDKFWTSIPEGRQQEAEDIGAIVEQHLKTK